MPQEVDTIAKAVDKMAFIWHEHFPQWSEEQRAKAGAALNRTLLDLSILLDNERRDSLT